jgi:hypothetical protein
MDVTENVRRDLTQKINSLKAEREDLEDKFGQVWSTEELSSEFEVKGFLAPFVVVVQKKSGAKGSMMFKIVLDFILILSHTRNKMATHLWNQTKMSKAGQRRLKKIYILALQRLLNPRYAKAFAIYAGERSLQGSIDYSFEYVLSRVKKITLEKYSQPIYLEAYDRLMENFEED